MATELSPNFTRRHYAWADWKVAYAKKGGQLQFDIEETMYMVWFYDGPEVHICELWVGDAPDGFDLAQNALDRADFEQHYKSLANDVIEPRAKDGRVTVRYSTANRTTAFKLRAICFYTAKADAVHTVNPVTNLDYGDVTVALYDAAGSLVAAGQEATAVRTVLDWEPHYDYEIVGGLMDLPSDLKDGTTNQWFMSAIGVPDYPPAYYGSIDYISEVNLEAVSSARIISDGRAVSFLPYNYGGNPHTNRMRFIIKHPAGAQKRFQIYIEHYT